MEPKNFSLFTSRLYELKHRIKVSCIENNISQSNIKILAVSKKKNLNDVKNAIANGLKNFGENYLNEAIEKKNALNVQCNVDNIEWHYIGAIQKNKTKKLAENFNWIHSVDRFEVAKRLSDQRPSHMKDLKIFLQVNIDNEEKKSGVMIEKTKDLAVEISKLPKLKLYGLMSIPRANLFLTDQRRSFNELNKLKNDINESGQIDQKLKSLSMGMSADLEAAIAETDSDSETWIRIGTALFGERSKI